MRKRDLFFYLVEENEERYNHFCQKLDADNKKKTEEQIVFIKDFYLRLLFRIALLEFKQISDNEIIESLNLDSDIIIFDLEKLQKTKGRYRNILDDFYKIFEDTYSKAIDGSIVNF